MRMSTRINVPKFSDAKTYERYKTELEAWHSITTLEADKIVNAIFLEGLPEEGKHAWVKDRVSDEFDLKAAQSKEGFVSLIAFLDKLLKLDELEEEWILFDEYDELKRLHGETIDAYITRFDAKYNQLAKRKLEVAPQLLAFTLRGLPFRTSRGQGGGGIRQKWTYYIFLI